MARTGRSALPGLVGPGGIALTLMCIGLVTLAPAFTGWQACSAKELRMQNLKEDLAQVFSKTDPSMASFFRMDGVVAEALPTPFLQRGGIARVVNRGTRVVRPTYVGFAENGFAEFLPGHRDAFARLIAKAGLNIGTDELRAALVQTFLETTAKQPSRFFLLVSADQIKPRPNLTADEQAAFTDLIAKYRNVITAPSVQSAGGGKWSTVRYALVDRDLVEFDVSIDSIGTLGVTDTVREKDLPIPYVMD